MSSDENSSTTLVATPEGEVVEKPVYDNPVNETPDGQLGMEFLRPLVRRAPENFELIHDFEDPATKKLPYPKNQAWVKCVAYADGQQWLIIASRTIGPLSSEDVRRKASEAVKKTLYSRHGMNDALAMFALDEDNKPIKDLNKLFNNQGRVLFCRAFRLVSSNL